MRALVADAQPIAAVRKRDPKPGAARGAIEPGSWSPDALGLPPECPVRPLGIDGSAGWFIDPIGQLQMMIPPYGKGHILGLFAGRADYLAWAWPRFGKGGVDGYAAEKCAADLIAACAAKGAWSSTEKVRGRGVWQDHSGNLVLHLGHGIYTRGQTIEPGEIGGHVYPARPRIESPYPSDLSAAQNPARLLKPMLATWAWTREMVDPHLLLGWIGVAYLGAAIPWRPYVYLSGDAGSGKSTLQELLRRLFGDWLISTTDTTAAGIYQHVGQDCLPVAVDEFEAEANTSRAKGILKLARQAASGGLMLRGGDRHKGVEFQARSAFIFSSINAPPLEPQDLSRIALLRLQSLRRGQAMPDLDPQALSVLGRCILAQIIREWPRLHETREAFRAELAAGGMEARGQDTFGTLLAMADLIEHSGWDAERLKVPVDGDLVSWGDLLSPERMPEYEDRSTNWRGCLNHLLQVPVDAWRNNHKSTVGQVLEAWSGGSEYTGLPDVNKVLSSAGLKVYRLREKGAEDWLFVQNNAPLVRKLYEGSKWAGEPGAGVWSGALRQAPPDLWSADNLNVNGVKGRGTLLRISALYGKGGLMVNEPGRDGDSLV